MTSPFKQYQKRAKFATRSFVRILFWNNIWDLENWENFIETYKYKDSKKSPLIVSADKMCGSISLSILKKSKGFKGLRVYESYREDWEVKKNLLRNWETVFVRKSLDWRKKLLLKYFRQSMWYNIHLLTYIQEIKYLVQLSNGSEEAGNMYLKTF